MWLRGVWLCSPAVLPPQPRIPISTIPITFDKVRFVDTGVASQGIMSLPDPPWPSQFCLSLDTKHFLKPFCYRPISRKLKSCNSQTGCFFSQTIIYRAVQQPLSSSRTLSNGWLSDQPTPMRAKLAKARRLLAGEEAADTCCRHSHHKKHFASAICEAMSSHTQRLTCTPAALQPQLDHQYFMLYNASSPCSSFSCLLRLRTHWRTDCKALSPHFLLCLVSYK